MDQIKEYVQKASCFGEYYKKNVYKNLQGITNEITNKFRDIFEDNAKDFGLVISNSVYSTIYLFEFTERIKDPDSVVEKLKNKNIIFQLANMFDITDLSPEKKIELDNYLYKIDDIIGIKILTSLNKDCSNVIKLIKNKISEFGDEISLDLEDDIPTKMSNGRQIYKIKGSYKNTYSFELQIKSNIDSTWGDLEHNLFYKDYDFNYIKNNNKEIMNGIGSLLEKTESLMFSIRQSKNEFEREYDRLSFYQAISRDYEDFVFENYSTNYILERNMDKLYDLYEYCYKEYSDVEDIKIEAIKIPITIHDDDLLSNNFMKLKLHNFDLVLLNIIHYNWNELKNTYESDIIRIEKLIEALLNHAFIKVSGLLDMTLVHDEYINSMMTILKNNRFDQFQKNVLLDTKVLAQVVLIESSISAIGENSKENEFIEFEELDEDIFDEFINELKLLLFNHIVIEEVEIKEDIDKRVYISKIINNVSSRDSSNRQKSDIIHETIKVLNNILGGQNE